MNETEFEKKPAFAGDEVLQEIWRIKDEIGAKYAGNIEQFFADIRERQFKSGHPIVSLEPRSIEEKPK